MRERLLTCARTCWRAATAVPATPTHLFAGGDVREHTYYRCASNERGEGHHVIRWREEDLERAIVDDLATIRLPSEDVISWFRDSVRQAFDDLGQLHRQQKQLLAKRKTELTLMQDRLLDGYLSGMIDEAAFQVKSAQLRRELGEVEEAMEKNNSIDPDAPLRALAVFDFSQNLVDIWRGSNSAKKRQILEDVSLNRRVDDATLVLEKRKPFDFLAERPFLKNGRGGRI